jgi:hypothetical protein
MEPRAKQREGRCAAVIDPIRRDVARAGGYYCIFQRTRILLIEVYLG